MKLPDFVIRFSDLIITLDQLHDLFIAHFYTKHTSASSKATYTTMAFLPSVGKKWTTTHLKPALVCSFRTLHAADPARRPASTTMNGADAPPSNARGRGRRRNRNGGRRGRGGSGNAGVTRGGHAAQNGQTRQNGQTGQSNGAANGFFNQNANPGFAVPSSTMVDTDVLRSTQRTTSTTLSEMTQDRFAALPIEASLKQAIAQELKYETMTTVQSKSIPVALTGNDVLVKARTGTGKTLAFLTPAFHRSLQSPVSRTRTAVLAISPTRELAQQIADEATVLLSHTNGAHAQVVFGGTPIRKDYTQLRSKGAPFLLVATPGRLLDHLTNPASGFKDALSSLSVLILDEADHLLDMGFRQEIEKVMRELPRNSPRQTLLFSATMPADVRSIAQLVLRPDYATIDCVGAAKNTHEHVHQSVFVSPIESQLAVLAFTLDQLVKTPAFKIIVFFTTARLTQFFAEVFNHMGKPVLEIHSRKSQGHRTKMSDRFRTQSNIVMFTSDVTARGLDYPDVTSVIQVGLPSDKNQYVHRIGRTARAGKVGNGVLLLADFERFFLNQIKEIPIEVESVPSETLDQYQPLVEEAVRKLPNLTKGSAYQSWLGYYNSNLKKLGWSKDELVERANFWARSVCGEAEPPQLLARTVGKMGLKGTPGLRIDRSGGGGGGRQGGGRGGGGRGHGGGRGGGIERGRVSRPRAPMR